MKPKYICANGHTFNEPLFGENPGWPLFGENPGWPLFDKPLGGPLYACPVCYTQDCRRYTSLDELKELDSMPKTRVTKPGRSIQGSTMVQFKCELCSCEFESPISECNLAIVFGNYDDFQVAHHNCPNEFCGVECEKSIEDLNIFGDQHG